MSVCHIRLSGGRGPSLTRAEKRRRGQRGAGAAAYLSRALRSVACLKPAALFTNVRADDAQVDPLFHSIGVGVQAGGLVLRGPAPSPSLSSDARARHCARRQSEYAVTKRETARGNRATEGSIGRRPPGQPWQRGDNHAGRPIRRRSGCRVCLIAGVTAGVSALPARSP